MSEHNLSLAQRLRKKLGELDSVHRAKCNAVCSMDETIRKETAAITELPMKHDQLKHVLDDLAHEHQRLKRKIELEQEKLHALAGREEEGLSRQAVRKNILTEVCAPEESCLISDPVDVSTAEVRRLKAVVTQAMSALLHEESALEEKMAKVRELMNPDAFQQTRHAMQAELAKKLEAKKGLDEEREQALVALTECQRLLEDIEERDTLLEYAKNNGLILVLGTTDELVETVRTHQEKVQAKNAAVDADHVFKAPRRPLILPTRPTSSSFNSNENKRRDKRPPHHEKSAETKSSSACNSRCSTMEKYQSRTYTSSRSSRGKEESACDCSDCRRTSNNRKQQGNNYQSESTRQFQRRAEQERRQNGGTIAGAINNKRKVQTRRENADGWTTANW